MNVSWRVCWILWIVCLPGLAVAADSKGGRVDVPEVDVPEKMVVQPTPEEIHQEFPERACSSCHAPNSLDAEPKPLNHFLTTRDCGACHFDKSWVPLRIYQHRTGRYRPNATPQDCLSCHTTNSEYIAR